MNPMRRDILRLGALAGISATGLRPLQAVAQQQELARIVVGFPAGSTVDVLARAMAKRMSGTYARSVIVDNRAGAAGQIGATAVKSGPRDGSALLLTPMTVFGVYPHTYKTLPYDPVADFAPVGNAVTYNYGVAVGSAVPASVTNIRQLLDWFKANPGKGNIGNPAVGSTLHFTGMLLARAAGMEIQQVSYLGQAMFNDLAGGTLPACVSTLGSLLPLHQAGRLRIIATTGEVRSPFLPDVGTLVEAGFKDLVFREWIGLFLPRPAAADQVAKANQALRGALAAQEVVDVLTAQAQEVTPSSAEELATLLRTDTQVWRQRVQAIGFTANS